ncbi:MAG: hypothetical protein H6807_06710 [Planctomycetes bacterium]|nr:hypothetical protein [Planctomycetota bacterium]
MAEGRRLPLLALLIATTGLVGIALLLPWRPAEPPKVGPARLETADPGMADPIPASFARRNDVPEVPADDAGISPARHEAFVRDFLDMRPPEAVDVLRSGRVEILLDGHDEPGPGSIYAFLLVPLTGLDPLVETQVRLLGNGWHQLDLPAVDWSIQLVGDPEGAHRLVIRPGGLQTLTWTRVDLAGYEELEVPREGRDGNDIADQSLACRGAELGLTWPITPLPPADGRRLLVGPKHRGLELRARGWVPLQLGDGAPGRRHGLQFRRRSTILRVRATATEDASSMRLVFVPEDDERKARVRFQRAVGGLDPDPGCVVATSGRNFAEFDLEPGVTGYVVGRSRFWRPFEAPKVNVSSTRRLQEIVLPWERARVQLGRTAPNWKRLAERLEARGVHGPLLPFGARVRPSRDGYYLVPALPFGRIGVARFGEVDEDRPERTWMKDISTDLAAIDTP